MNLLLSSLLFLMYIAMFNPSYVNASSKPKMKRQYSSVNINDVGTGKLVMFLITKERTQILVRITSFFFCNFLSLYLYYFISNAEVKKNLTRLVNIIHRNHIETIDIHFSCVLKGLKLIQLDLFLYSAAIRLFSSVNT